MVEKVVSGMPLVADWGRQQGKIANIELDMAMGSGLLQTWASILR
jgi:hypothetical protein